MMMNVAKLSCFLLLFVLGAALVSAETENPWLVEDTLPEDEVFWGRLRGLMTESEFSFSMSMSMQTCPKATHRQTLLYNVNSNPDTDKHVGVVVSTSSDGKRVAVLKQLLDDSAVVQVYGNNFRTGEEWVQLGQDVPIFGKIQREWWAFSKNMVALAGNGRQLVVASPFSDEANGTGRVDVYERRGGNPNWRRIRNPITGIDSPRFQMSVAVPFQAFAIAVATDRRMGSDSGYARVYGNPPLEGDWDLWDEILPDYDGDDGTVSNFGRRLAMSADGNRIGVSFFRSIGDEPKQFTRVYRFSAGNYLSFGSDIEGSGPSFSKDGDVVAISTAAKVYSYNDEENEWIQLGNDLFERGDDNYVASISGKGNRVALGDPLRDVNKGRVLIFDLHGAKWCKILETAGRNDFVNFGYSVSLSDDGNRYAVGAPFIQFNFGDSYAEVYEIAERRQE